MDKPTIEQLGDTLIAALPQDHEATCAVSCAVEIAVRTAANVGRIADALEAIARNTAPVVVENKTDAPGREIIGIPAER